MIFINIFENPQSLKFQSILLEKSQLKKIDTTRFGGSLKN